MRNCFTPMDKAIEDVEMVMVGNDLKVMDELQQFDYLLATAYDPSMPNNAVRS